MQSLGWLTFTVTPSQPHSLVEGCLHTIGFAQQFCAGGGQTGAHAGLHTAGGQAGLHTGAHGGGQAGLHTGAQTGLHTGAQGCGQTGLHTGAHTGLHGSGHTGFTHSVSQQLL